MSDIKDNVDKISSSASALNMQPQFVAICLLYTEQRKTNEILNSLLINIKQLKDKLTQ